MQVPLVFLHGFLGTSADFDPVCSHLSMHHCIKIDLPGHGAAPFTENFFDIMPSFPKMHLIGYSMGGRLAMQYAAALPEKIESLTLLSASVGLNSPQEKQKRYEADQLWARKMRQSFDDFLTEWYDQPIFAGFTPDLTMRKKQNPTELAKALIHYSLGRQNALQPKNATFIVGERDVKYRALYPQAIVIPNAGHMVHLEQPAAVAEIIKKGVILNM